MTLRPYDLRDPGEVVGHVLATYLPHEGDAYLALVHDPPGTQELLHVTPVPATTWAAVDEYDRSEFLGERVHELPIDTDTWSRPEHALVTVIVRSGLTVFGAYEYEWLLAWRYANHFAPVFTAGPVLVTQYGWVDFMSQRGGVEPFAPGGLHAGQRPERSPNSRLSVTDGP